MEQFEIIDFEGKTLLLSEASIRKNPTAMYLKEQINDLYGINIEDFFLEQESRVVPDNKSLSELSRSTIYMKGRIMGGKGGFGSLLRGQAPKKKYTSNFDQCRDLSGKRLRQTRNEKQRAEMRQRLEEEEKLVEEEMKEYKSKKKEMEDAMYANKFKLDGSYKKQLIKSEHQITEAVRQGMHKKKAAKLSLKRSQPEKTEQHSESNPEEPELKRPNK